MSWSDPAASLALSENVRPDDINTIIIALEDHIKADDERIKSSDGKQCDEVMKCLKSYAYRFRATLERINEMKRRSDEFLNNIGES